MSDSSPPHGLQLGCLKSTKPGQPLKKEKKKKNKLPLSNVQLLNFVRVFHLIICHFLQVIKKSDSFRDHPVEQQPVPASTSQCRCSLPAVCLLKKLFICLAVPRLSLAVATRGYSPVAVSGLLLWRHVGSRLLRLSSCGASA